MFSRVNPCSGFRAMAQPISMNIYTESIKYYLILHPVSSNVCRSVLGCTKDGFFRSHTFWIILASARRDLERKHHNADLRTQILKVGRKHAANFAVFDESKRGNAKHAKHRSKKHMFATKYVSNDIRCHTCFFNAFVILITLSIFLNLTDV